ncbi:MAG: hypothetical protein JHC93_05210 [Parachlamydiales bacterium]|nr:hypothetical protein [Parachlamydiales bacterium]
MIQRKFIGFSFSLFLACSSLFSNTHYTNDIELGAVGYNLTRTKTGGTKQKGLLTGLIVNYDRIKRNSFYLGADAYWAKGDMHGHSGSGRILKSIITDIEAEGRVGFTIRSKGEKKPFFTPFVGYGYFRETNQFKAPYPMTITYNDSFDYYAVGFVSGINVCKDFSVGINVKWKWMNEGTCKISNEPIDDYTDPSTANPELIIESQWQYTIEMPLDFHPKKWSKRCWLNLVPFYEYRHFGGRENFPSDYIDTQERILGARLTFLFRF